MSSMTNDQDYESQRANGSSWHIFNGKRDPHPAQLPEAPPWRRFKGKIPDSPAAEMRWPQNPDVDAFQREKTYKTPENALDAINAALILRRPLLVTGKPGTGKSSLAYRVAYELALGPVLVWAINSRSTLKDGLYDYDALARLHAQQVNPGETLDIGDYIKLGALGTALLPSARPRVLLIDELDKADPDLPNDLLNVFEEGWFLISELQRWTHDTVSVRTLETRDTPATQQKVAIEKGRIECAAFPFIVMTSNGERDFPPAFLRRCIRLELAVPDERQLLDIVRAHLGQELADKASEQIQAFANDKVSTRATDQLLNALFVVHGVSGGETTETATRKLFDMLTLPLD